MPNPPPRPSPDAADVCAELRDIAERYPPRVVEGDRETMIAAAAELDRLRALVAGGEWVSVEERLPERGIQVLCAWRDSVFAGFNLGPEKNAGWWDENGGHVEVTHWRPLPPAPSRVGVESRP